MNHFKPFSALILNGLRARQVLCNGTPDTPGKRSGCTEVVAYQCNTCRETYDDEDEAEDCCSTDDIDGESDHNCPVCGEESYDYRAATDCCMWKDLDAPKRWAIADAVEAGATWQEAIQQHTGQSIN